jgi:hypothetical protein
MSLGERACDVAESSPPCAVSWGGMQLIYVAVVVAVCLSLGWLVGLVVRHHDDER